MFLSRSVISLFTATLLVTPACVRGDDTALEASKQAGQQAYMAVCFACHQPTGMGIPGMFPPLAGSDWVTAGKPDRLIRMILHGITGPIKINGQPFATPAPLMPAQSTLTDEQVANVLTYIRNSWGNAASAVTAAEVAAIRSAESGRATPWTEDELLKIPTE